jgi:hypothetical protein
MQDHQTAYRQVPRVVSSVGRSAQCPKNLRSRDLGGRDRHPRSAKAGTSTATPNNTRKLPIIELRIAEPFQLIFVLAFRRG